MNSYTNNQSKIQVLFMLLLVLGGIGLADLDLGNLTALDGSVQIKSSLASFDRRTGLFSTTVTATNISSEPITGPLYLVVDSTTPAAITVANGAGVTADGKAYFDLLQAGEMVSGAALSTKVSFNNPQRIRFTYTFSIYKQKYHPIPLPKFQEINGKCTVLEGVSLPASGLILQGFFDQSPFSEDYSFSIKAVNAGAGQIFFVSQSAGDPILVLYLSAEKMSNLPVSFTVDNVAQGLILFNPYIMILPKSEQDRLAMMALNHESFSELCELIQAGLEKEPQNLMNYSINPKMFELALQIGINLLQNQTQQPMQPIVMAAQIGEDSNPHIKDISGSLVTFVNPKICFYGVDIKNRQTGSHIEDILMEGKDSLLQLKWGWPPVVKTPPDTEDYDLGDGRFIVTFFKGFNVQESGWLNPKEAPGQATWGNFLYTVNILLDWTAWSPFDKGDIGGIINFIDDPALEGFGDFAGEISNDWLAVVKKGIEVMSKKDNWQKISYWIWQEFPSTNTADTMASAGKIFTNVSKALKALKVVDAANKEIPFFWDLATGPWKLIYEFDQTSGELQLISSKIPPTVSILWSPYHPVVGETVAFDAGETRDDRDTLSNIRFRWDYESDGVWDTQWSNSTSVTHSYSNAGVYIVKIEAQDGDGNIGHTIRYILVESDQGGGSAKHVKVFRDRLPWDSSSFTSVMASLGFTEGIGNLQYEILDSSQMANAILEPGVDFVMIVNDQTQTFYNRLAASYWRFNNFLQNGGTIFWGACDRGWGNGVMSDAGLNLPNGVTYTYTFDYYNYVPDNTKILTMGLPYSLYGSYASHEAFQNLPANTTVYTVDGRGLPTLIEYNSGDGWILVTGQPLEYHYDRNQGPAVIYKRVLEYVIGTAYQQNSPVMNKLLTIPMASEDISMLPSHIEDSD